MERRPLEKIDTNALRQSTHICFDHIPVGKRNGNTAGMIRCCKRLSEVEREREPYAPASREHSIEVDSELKIYSGGSGNRQYSEDQRNHLRNVLKGYVYLEHYKHQTSVLGSIARIIKPGDHVNLVWMYDAGNTNSYNVNLHVDRLEIEITRPGKKKDQEFRFLVDYCINPGNTARMIQESR